MSTDAGVEDRLRALAPQVLGALVRRHGQFDACEDAVQEALIAAAAQWPTAGVPDNPRAWLLALMLLTDARRAARTAADGSLVPLAEQDRGRWNAQEIAEGIALVTDALAGAPLGPYQVQAAIAAVHAEAAEADETDWPQIVALYRVLERVAPNPMVTLNHAVAVAMVDGPQAGLVLLATDDEPARAASSRRSGGKAGLRRFGGRRSPAVPRHRPSFATESRP